MLATLVAVAAWTSLVGRLSPRRVALAADGGAPDTKTSPAAQGSSAGGLTAEQRELLSKSKFVYISSTRKDGSLSKPAEIWFLFADGSIWVASAPTSWRAKRIRWKRPMATIWIGSPSGPSIRARGEFVTDEKRYDELCAAYAVKYPERWTSWEKSFREGLRSGERVLIRYTPVAG